MRDIQLPTFRQNTSAQRQAEPGACQLSWGHGDLGLKGGLGPGFNFRKERQRLPKRIVSALRTP